MNQPRTFSILAVLVLAFASRSTVAQNCDHCGEVLRSQHPIEYMSKTDRGFASDVWSFFCSATFESQTKDGSAEVTVPLEGLPVPFGAGAKYRESWTKRSEACSGGRSKLAMHEAAQVYFKLVPEAVQLGAQLMWGECVKDCTIGTMSHVTLSASKVDDTHVNFTLALKPETTVAYVTRVIASNLSCSGLIVPPARITPAGIGSNCTIDTVAQVSSLTVIPSYGAPVSRRIDPPAPPPPPPLPQPTSVSVGGSAWEGDFDCGKSMSCADNRVLAGIRDGTSCLVLNRGRCATISVWDQFGKIFSAVKHVNCEPLDQFSCGQLAVCPGNKVLVGFKDGTGCEVMNGGQCCDLVLAVGGDPIEPRGCTWTDEFSCGESRTCGSDQVMVGLRDGTSCEVTNKIRCCALALK